jgi:hypothetical protein
MEFISETMPARDAGGVMPSVSLGPGFFFGQDPMKYSLADLTIDTGDQLVSRAASPIPLPKLSYDLLLALVRAAPNLVSSASACLALKQAFSIGHFMMKQPFKNPADAASLAESMRMAELPD